MHNRDQFAGIGEAAKQKIISTFDPLIDLIIALSLPISGVMLSGGALMIMVGIKDAGFKLIMNGGLGYVLVQMSPLFIDLLSGAGALYKRCWAKTFLLRRKVYYLFNV